MQALNNSFEGAELWMKQKDSFNAILEFCQFPEMVPLTYVDILKEWVQDRLFDSLFIDLVALNTPDLLVSTQCLVAVYGGQTL